MTLTSLFSTRRRRSHITRQPALKDMLNDGLSAPPQKLSKAKAESPDVGTLAQFIIAALALSQPLQVLRCAGCSRDGTSQ